MMHSPRLLAPKLPQFAIPTTPTSASVKAGTAVHDPANGTRHAMFDPKTRAGAVFIHPALLATAPGPLVSSAATDALIAAIEGLTSSRSGDPLADASLMHAVRLLTANLAQAALGDEEARMAVMLGAVLAGQGTDFTGAGLATALGHAIGALAGIENGLAKAIVLPAVLCFNGDAAAGGLSKIAAALGNAGAGSAGVTQAVIGGLAELFATLGYPHRLRDAGVSEESLPRIAGKTMDDWFLLGNARRIRDVGEVERVLRKAW
jgi:alcohol dehydrogenase class IV